MPTLISEMDGNEDTASRSSRFTPGQLNSGTQWKGDWVGHRAGIHVTAKIKIPVLT